MPQALTERVLQDKREGKEPMEKISASKLLAGLVPAGSIPEEVQVESVTTDSREVRPGCIFVAFPGEKFDGHDFAAKALENGDLSAFFALVKASGTSSWELLQNLYSCQKPEEQAIPLGIWYSQQFLGDKGAVRVHGGGFAGTIQAFVPTEEAEAYCRYMDDLFGKGSCHKLSVRPLGGVML